MVRLGYILMAQLTECTAGLVMGCQGKRGTRITPRPGHEQLSGCWGQSEGSRERSIYQGKE